jgi:hypothetical protein
VQLEGLVEGEEYLDVLADQRVGEYLADRDVRFYVRGDDLPGPATVPVADPGCAGFLEPAQGDGPKSAVVGCDRDLRYDAVGDGFRWRIWQYRG